MPKHTTREVLGADLAEHLAVNTTQSRLAAELLAHPATRAWAQLPGGRAEPREIVRLQKKHKGLVYRLVGAGPGGTDVVAKQSSPERILRERLVYEQILSTLPVSVVRYYGTVEEPEEGCSWLFLEDAGSEAYAPHLPEHRAFAGRWLGLLHTSSACMNSAASRLPDLGPAYYREHLRSAHDTIRCNRAKPALTAEERAVLDTVLWQCEVVAAHWDWVEAVCARAPQAFIHGDFAPKNMRVRPGTTDHALLPFDWGSAGWGLPAADLVQLGHSPWLYWAAPDLDAYRAAVRDVWPHLDVPHLRRLAIVGKLFRCLVCLDLDAKSLTTEWVEGSVRKMRVYAAEVADALEAAGWPRPESVPPPGAPGDKGGRTP